MSSNKVFMYHSNRLTPLVGAKVTSIVVDVQGFSDTFTGFILEKDGVEYQVVALSDAEGNGAGHLEILNTKTKRSI